MNQIFSLKQVQVQYQWIKLDRISIDIHIVCELLLSNYNYASLKEYNCLLKLVLGSTELLFRTINFYSKILWFL